MIPLSRLAQGVCVSLLAVTMASPAANVRVSTDANGKQGQGVSDDAAMSADGRWVAFTTTSKLLPEDANAKADVYLKDMQTGALRLVSDARGGDQPSITADGRLVVYRAFFDLPQIRLFDRDGRIEPFTVSFPNNDFSSNSNRPADNAVISADGTRVAFVRRPAPNSTDPDKTDTRVAIYTLGGATMQTIQTGLADVGRLAISGDGSQVFYETADALNLVDTNGSRDIYMDDQFSGGVNPSLWVSRPDLGQPVEGTSHSPAAVFDGGKLFFISTGVLTASDADGRASVYRADISGSNVVLTHVPTDREPLALSENASLFGKFIAYLGEAATGKPVSLVRDLVSGTEMGLARFTGRTSAPHLSGDGSRLLFASPSSLLVPGDTNGKIDVFLVDSPLGTPPNTPPVPVLNGVPANPIANFAGFNLNAAATPGSGALRFLSIDIDGFAQFSSNGAAIPNTAFSLPKGIYTAEARAIDDAGITTRSAAQTIIVMPSNTLAGITGVTALTKTLQADGTTVFNGTIRVDNRRATATGPLRLLIVESSVPVTMGPNFGDETLVPDRGQNVIAVVDIAALAAFATAEVPIAGVVSAGEVIEEGFQGNGWIVDASLQEQSGQNFAEIDEIELFRVAPQLEGDTPGPNVGVPVFGTPNGAPDYVPPVLQSIAITGPPNVAEFAKANYRAIATFSDSSTKPCSVTWSLTNATGIATISASGVLSAGDVTGTKQVQVNATLGGKSAQFTVNIKPVTPTVSIVAEIPKALEIDGTVGRFKITRTPLTPGALDVTYTITGKAIGGTDYELLTGAAQILAGTSRVSFDVEPLTDVDFEGLEDVTLTLQPSSDYRLKTKTRATVRIVDDEAFPPGAVDAAIKRGTAAPVGRDVFDQAVFPPQFPATQTLAANGKLNKAVAFTLIAVNRDSVARTITVSGARDSAGFTARYFLGKNEVTAEVGSGTFTFPDVPAGAAVSLSLKITPTADAAVGSLVRALINFATSTGFSDTVEAVVTRAN